MKKNKIKWLNIISIGVSILSLIFSAYFNCETRKEIDINRINQVSVDANSDRVIQGPQKNKTDSQISYKVSVHNGSDVTIYDANLIVPGELVETNNGKFLINKKKEVKGVPLGDIAPNSKVTITIKLRLNNEAQLGDCELEYKDKDGIRWLKKQGQVSKKIGKTKSKYTTTVNVISFKEN